MFFAVPLPKLQEAGMMIVHMNGSQPDPDNPQGRDIQGHSSLEPGVSCMLKSPAGWTEITWFKTAEKAATGKGSTQLSTLLYL